MRFRNPSRAAGALAAAVLVIAGCDSVAADTDGHDDGHADHADDNEPIDGASEVAVTGGSLSFTPDRLELDAGEPVNVALTSVDIVHDLVVDEVDFHLAADAGQTTTGALTIDEPGTYVGYCSVPGHQSAGMELEIVVR